LRKAFVREVESMVRSRIQSALKRPALLALAVAAALALGACGGSSTTTVTTTSTPTGPTTSSTPTTPTTSTTGAGTTTTGNVRQAFDAALRNNLLNQQNLTHAQTNCVIQKLDQSLSAAEIQQVAQGQFPSSLAQKAGQAGVSCASP
jgi:hypothetical protein